MARLDQLEAAICALLRSRARRSLRVLAWPQDFTGVSGLLSLFSPDTRSCGGYESLGIGCPYKKAGTCAGAGVIMTYRANRE